MINRFLFLSLFLYLVSTVLGSTKIACNKKSADQLDDYVRKLSVLGDYNGKYPSNEKEAVLHCADDQKMTYWGTNYSKTCMNKRETETSHHVTNLLFFSMNSVSRKRCRTETARKLFINAGKCGNLVLSDTTKCFDQYAIESEQINRSKKTRINDKHAIPLICCAYHKFYDCCDDAYTNPKHAKTCTQKATVELQAWIRESLYDVIQYLCGDYQGSSDKCDRLVGQYKDIYDTKVKTVPKSPLGPSNQVFDSLE